MEELNKVLMSEIVHIYNSSDRKLNDIRDSIVILDSHSFDVRNAISFYDCIFEKSEKIEIGEVPKEAYEFFQEWKDRGEKGAPAWGKIPHVFVKGKISVEGLEIIDWVDPI